MAIAGDVVIKLAADVAELKEGLADASAKLDAFGKTAREVGDSMTAAATKGAVFGNLISQGITSVISEMKRLSQESEKAAVATADVAAKFKLTTDQAQALQFMSQRSGVSMQDLAKQFKGNTSEIDKMVEALKAHGMVMDSDFIQRSKQAAEQAEDTTRKIQVLWAAIAGPVEKAAENALAKVLASVGASMAIIRANGADTLTIIRSLLNLLSLGIAGAAAGGGSQIEDLDRRIRDLGDTWSETDRQIRAIEAKPQPLEFAGEQQHLERLRRQRDELTAQIRANSAIAGQLRTPTLAPITVTATATGGGGGGGGSKTDEDLMEAQIRRYEALGAAARRTGEVISNYAGRNVDDLQREVKVTQAIEDIVGRLGAKYEQASQAQKDRLRAAVEADLLQREINARALEYAKQAEDIELRLGDASAQRLRTARELARLQAAGLSGPALERYRKQTEEANKLQELNAKRYDDSIESLGAGFEAAAERYSRAHDMFASGEAAFQGTIDALGQAFDVLAGRSNKSFEQIAADFASMLSKIAAQMAISEAFKWLIKIGGAALGSGDITAAAAPAGGYSAGIDVNGNSWITPRAGGGDVYPGNTYRVGEYGPETFVPRAVGRIEPYSGNNQNGGNVTVNLDMKKAEGARDPTAAVEFGRRVKAAVQNVIENEKRPGGTLYTRATAA